MNLDKLKSLKPTTDVEPVKKKRKRRTKAEMAEARRLEEAKKLEIETEPLNEPEPEPKKKKKKKESAYWDNLPPMKTSEQVSDEMIQKAIDNNYDDPYFDFRIDYEKGQKIWYVDYNKICNTVELRELVLNTVYSRVMIGYVDNGEARDIPYAQRDLVFLTPRDAEDTLKEYKKKLK
jgi:hypothetical protein